MRKQIIFDCDNTFGVQGCDVDDGLALLYLLNSKHAEIKGITTTYGNSDVETVYQATTSMLRDIERTDIVVKKGEKRRGCTGSKAAHFLVETVNAHPMEISILATGSLTNLWSAHQLDPHFFSKVKEIVLMGGITEPLLFEKKVMDELNFSCDPIATELVLKKGNHVSIITGNNCLKVLFTKEDYKKYLFDHPTKTGNYILEKTDYWFHYNETDYGIKGYYNWDVTAAVYLMHPELFEDKWGDYNITAKDLETGYLCRQNDDPKNARLNLPQIKDGMVFKENIFRTWSY